MTVLTKITENFLRRSCACREGVKWFLEHPELHGASWQDGCAALEADGQPAWSEQVRTAVARCGNAKDCAILRGDKSEQVRWEVARYGNDEDRSCLRNDESEWVRTAVAIYGTAEDRAILRSDKSAWVRVAIARHGNAEDRAILRNDKSELVRANAEYFGRND